MGGFTRLLAASVLIASAALGGCSERRTILLQARDTATHEVLAGARVECCEGGFLVLWRGERSGECDGAGMVRLRIPETWDEFDVTLSPAGEGPAAYVVVGDWRGEHVLLSGLQSWQVGWGELIMCTLPIAMVYGWNQDLALGPCLILDRLDLAPSSFSARTIPSNSPLDAAPWTSAFALDRPGSGRVEVRLQVLPREPAPRPRK